MDKYAIKTLSDAMVAIKSRNFIVGSVNSSGDFSISKNPVVHATLQEAANEATRLTSSNPGKMFFVVQLAAGRMLPASPAILSI